MMKGSLANLAISVGMDNAIVLMPINLALWGFVETIRTKAFSSGLLSSVITWILAYLIIRYSLMKGQITPQQFGVSLSIGLALSLSMDEPLITGKLRRLS
jgi:predicted tellurium resistance membrane protein TerC